jgi:hypothetical protein
MAVGLPRHSGTETTGWFCSFAGSKRSAASTTAFWRQDPMIGASVRPHAVNITEGRQKNRLLGIAGQEGAAV